MNYEDGCLFKFWQEVYIGNFMREGKLNENFKVIVQNSNQKFLIELSTILSVSLAMVLMIWITYSAEDLTKPSEKVKKD